QPAQTLALSVGAHAEPRQHGYGQGAARQVLARVGRQVAEIYLGGRQRVVTGNGPARVEQDPGDREMLVLMLERLWCRPLLHRPFAAAAALARVVAAQPLQAEPVRPADAVHDSPRITAPRRRCRSVGGVASFSAVQKASCSSGVSAMVCSRAASTSFR